MKYKTIDIALENVLEFCGSKELFKQTYKSLLKFDTWSDQFERVIQIRCYKWRVVISLNKLIQANQVGLYDMEQQLEATGTDDNTASKATGNIIQFKR